MIKREGKFKAVPCPTCGRGEGDPCRTRTGGQTPEAHAARHYAYYNKFPDQAPVWWHARHPAPPPPVTYVEGNTAMHPEPFVGSERDKIASLSESLDRANKTIARQNQQLDALEIRKTALDEAIRSATTLNGNSADDVVKRAAAYEKYLRGPGFTVEEN